MKTSEETKTEPNNNLVNEREYYVARRDNNTYWAEYVRDGNGSAKRSVYAGSWCVLSDDGIKSQKTR